VVKSKEVVNLLCSGPIAQIYSVTLSALSNRPMSSSRISPSSKTQYLGRCAVLCIGVVNVICYVVTLLCGRVSRFVPQNCVMFGALDVILLCS